MFASCGKLLLLCASLVRLFELCINIKSVHKQRLCIESIDYNNNKEPGSFYIDMVSREQSAAVLRLVLHEPAGPESEN